MRTITVAAMAVLVGRANWWPLRSGRRRKPPARRLREQEQSERVRTPVGIRLTKPVGRWLPLARLIVKIQTETLTCYGT